MGMCGTRFERTIYFDAFVLIEEHTAGQRVSKSAKSGGMRALVDPTLASGWGTHICGECTLSIFVEDGIPHLKREMWGTFLYICDIYIT